MASLHVDVILDDRSGLLYSAAITA